jgi:hypothetical protein
VRGKREEGRGDVLDALPEIADMKIESKGLGYAKKHESLINGTKQTERSLLPRQIFMPGWLMLLKVLWCQGKCDRAALI